MNEKLLGRRHYWIPWVIGGIVLLVILCVLIGFLGYQLFQGTQYSTSEALSVVEQFLQAGMHNDPSAGTALMAEHQTRPSIQADIARLYATRPEIFRHYKQLEQRSLSLVTSTSGRTVRIDGEVVYTDNSRRPFTAQLRQENGAWRIVVIEFHEGVGE